MAVAAGSEIEAWCPACKDVKTNVVVAMKGTRAAKTQCRVCESVHPYRKDALDALSRGHARGARLVKWLPNAMGIDPSNPKCVPYYDRMRELGMILLSHGGFESAVAGADKQAFGNPLRLRAALDRGVKVIVAHCASFGENADLDHPDRPAVSSYELFLRLMNEPRYDGLVFGEISAITLFNRTPDPLMAILGNTALHGRLVNGSDYPIPAINILVQTSAFVDEGLITEDERAWLNEIYEYNPLLFDFVVKRTIRLPGRKEGFPVAIFTRRLF